MPYLYEDLTKKIIGAAQKVYNTLGYGYKEKQYQRAIEETLRSLSINYKRELKHIKHLTFE